MNQHHPQYGSNFQPAAPQPPRKAHWVRTVGLVLGIGVASLVVLGLILGAVASGQADGKAASVAASQVTVTAPPVTVTIPGKPGAAVTVTAAPKPAVTVTAPAKTVTAEPAQAPAAMEEGGTYLVGTDVKPGTYKSAGGEGCYWERLKNLDGGLTSIIANEFVDGGTTIVTIKNTDKAFKFNDCASFVKIK